MRNAVASRLSAQGAPVDALLLNGIDEVMARQAGGPVSIDAMRQDLRLLLDAVTARAPGVLASHTLEVTALTEPGFQPSDPAIYFRRALALLASIADALGEPGLLDSSGLDLIRSFAEWEEKVLRSKKKVHDASGVAAPDGFSTDVIRRLLATELPHEPDIKISHFSEIMGGMSKRSFRLTIETESRGTEHFIVKKADDRPGVELDCMAIRNEFSALKAVHKAGILAPEPLWMGRDIAGAGGDFYIMRQSPGSCSTTILNANSPISSDVLLQIAEQMARLHTVALADFGEFPDEIARGVRGLTTAQAVAWRLEEWRRIWRKFEALPSPLENYLFSWLKANIPANSAPPSLIHGDLTPHNCLWEDNRLTAVLDWECAHFGDPAEDMAYAKPLIEQRMDWDVFTAHYEAHGGPKVSPRAIAYYSCYLNIRSVILSNVLVAQAHGEDLRPLIVDTDFCGLFADTCMSGIRKFEALEHE